MPCDTWQHGRVLSFASPLFAPFPSTVAVGGAAVGGGRVGGGGGGAPAVCSLPRRCHPTPTPPRRQVRYDVRCGSDGRLPPPPPLPAATPTSITTTHLSIRLAGTTRYQLRDVSLTCPPGGVTMLVGPGGCGKSTLLRVLCRLLLPVDGAVSVPPPSGFVAQAAHAQTVMPAVGADVALGMGAAGAALSAEGMQAAVVDALAEVGLTGDGWLLRGSEELSGGERARVAVASVLVGGAGCLLLDEVTAALDAGGGAGLVQMVRAIAVKRHIPVLWYVV